MKRIKFFIQGCLKRHFFFLIAICDRGSLMSKIARFIACEKIAGDYYEFGVYRGNSFINSYKWLEWQFRKRVRLDVGGVDARESELNRKAIWNNMRFFAFDSFEGLPELTTQDQLSQDFEKGQFACSAKQFAYNLKWAGVPLWKTQIIKGWFVDTCVSQTLVKYKMNKAAVIWLDGDLYSSAKTVLEFVTEILQDGTIIVFDDWFSYKGSPYAGEQLAFYEWYQRVSDQYSIHEYQRDSWKRMSFIVSRKPVK